jgi:hypothetical protein
MHHMIQSNMYSEFGFHRLVGAIKDLGLPYGIFKLRPFDHEIEWVDGVISGGATPTMVWGTVNVERVSGMYGWHPGIFKNENFDMRVLHREYGGLMLNDDAKFYKLGEVPSFEGTAFIRPVLDTKSFAGQLINGDEFEKWRNDLFALRDEFTTVDLNTEVMIASPKQMTDEARFFVVNREVVAGSMYRVDGRVMYKAINTNVPLYQPLWDFADSMVRGNPWRPCEAFVMDVARTAHGHTWDKFRVIEVNCINSAGFYDCNMSSVVRALEGLHPWPERWKIVDNDDYKAQPWEKVIDDRKLDEWRKANGYGHVVERRATSSTG